MPIRKKVYFNQKFAHHYYSSGNSPNTITLSYSVEYLTRKIFCESVLGLSHIKYAEDFAHLGQKEQFKIKMNFRQIKKTTRGSPQISRGQQFLQ